MKHNETFNILATHSISMVMF